MQTADKSSSPVVHKAIDMAPEQLGCDPAEAAERLTERATSVGYRIFDYARMIVDGVIRFDR